MASEVCRGTSNPIRPPTVVFPSHKIIPLLPPLKSKSLAISMIARLSKIVGGLDENRNHSFIRSLVSFP